jgi:hypothetical protein
VLWVCLPSNKWADHSHAFLRSSSSSQKAACRPLLIPVKATSGTVKKRDADYQETSDTLLAESGERGHIKSEPVKPCSSKPKAWYQCVIEKTEKYSDCEMSQTRHDAQAALNPDLLNKNEYRKPTVRQCS